MHTDFDPRIAVVADVFSETYEIPSVMIVSMVGTDQENAEKLSYKGCTKCNFKKMAEDGVCSRCKGTESADRFILNCTISDPTGSVDGTMFHQAAEEFLADDELIFKPCVALVYISPDTRTPGKHVLEIFAVKPMYTVNGVLNVFRAPAARFLCSGNKVMPTYPKEVIMSGMSQTSVCGMFCTSFRFVVKIKSSKATTVMDETVDGMSCEHTAECCLSSDSICLKLAGCFDAVQPLFALKKKDMVHVLCTFTGHRNSEDLPIYTPLKIFAISDEDKNTVLKSFKYEVTQVQAHFGNSAEIESPQMSTPDMKRKTDDNRTFCSPGWSSPQRRLKIAKTDDATNAGLGLLELPRA